MLKIPLSDSAFKGLRDYIYDNSGIFIADTKKYLIENRLSRILQEKKLTTFDEYLSVIKTSSNGNELTRLFDAVTTNETYFFREPLQLDVFIDSVFRNILETKKSGQIIKIWSSACSSGEEPYTLSLLLKDKNLDQNVEIFGSDLCVGALSTAKRAVYNNYAIRNVPKPYLEKYFTSSGGSYTLCDPIKNSVDFKKANLIDETSTKPLRGMDIIFCRNVLIYFDTKAKQKVVSGLYDSLVPGGYLIIGSSESLRSVTRAFRPIVINKVIVYRKE